MNEKRIEQVLEIERQAQTVHDQAVSEAEQLPRQAEKDAQATVEQARAKAEEQARKMIAEAQSEDQSARILADTQKEAQRTEAAAMNNLDRAVSYVLARVVGREQS